jgi:hypothetical protein
MQEKQRSTSFEYPVNLGLFTSFIWLDYNMIKGIRLAKWIEMINEERL